MNGMDEARRLLTSDSEDDRRKGVALVQDLEARGDPLARYAVATWHIHGAHGWPVDVDKGLAMLSSAAGDLVPEALYDMGHASEELRLTPKPRRTAFGYYLASALLGDQDALAELYRCFWWGIGAFQDREIAEIIRKIALAKGVPEEDL